MLSSQNMLTLLNYKSNLDGGQVLKFTTSNGIAYLLSINHVKTLNLEQISSNINFDELDILDSLNEIMNITSNIEVLNKQQYTKIVSNLKLIKKL